MTTRGRNSSADWDPMKDDYNNSSYDAQYQDNDNSSSRQLDHRKLYITNLPPGLNDNGLRSAFEKYGQIEHSFLSKDPTKKYAFVTFETAAEARIAMMKLNKTEPLNLNVNIGHSKGSGSNNNNGQNYNGTRERDRGHRDFDRTSRDNDRAPRDNDRAPRDSERAHRNSERVPRDNERIHRDSGSYVSNTSIERRARNQEEPMVSEMESHSDMSMGINRDFHIQLEQIKLEKLRIQEEQLECKQKMMMLTLEKQPISNSNMAGSTRRMMPDGRIIVQSQVEKAPEADKSFTAGAGDSLNIPGLQRVRRQTCNDCGAAADMYCARCGVVPYCSTQCQRRDWHKRHKSVCHNLARLSSADSEPAPVAESADDVVDEGAPPPPAPLRRPRSPIANRNQPQRDRAQPSNLNNKIPNKTRFVPPDHHPQSTPAPRTPRVPANNKPNYQNNNTQDDEDWGEKKNTEPKAVPKPQDAKPVTPKIVDVKDEVPMRRTPEKSDNSVKPNEKMGANLSNLAEPKPMDVDLVPAQYLIEKLPIGESFLLSVDHLAQSCATLQSGFVCLVLHADYQDQYNLLLEDIFENENPCTPRPGDTVAYLDASDGGWYRARCLSSTRAALLDSGKVVSLTPADQCRPLADKYKHIPEFCCLFAGNVQLGMSLKCTIMMKSGEEFRVSVDVHEEDTYLGEGTVARWQPTVERTGTALPTTIKTTQTVTTPVQPKQDKQPVQATPPQPRQEKPQAPTPNQEPKVQVETAKAPAAKIPEVTRPAIINNGRYYLMHVTSLKRACIRPCNAESTAEFEGILQDVLLYGVQKSKQLTAPPQPGDLVLCLFEDIHYRALVRRTKAKDNRYMVEYVEYGNEEIVPLEKLFTCPAELDLTSRPAQASIVQLSTIATVELTPPALQYVDEVKELAELIAKISGGAKTVTSGSLVELVVEKNMEAVNKKLEQMCTPDWKKLEEGGGDVLESEVVLFSQMKSHPLPADSEFDMDVTDFSNIENGLVCGFLKGDKLADYIYGPLTDKINEYCKSELCSEPYLPMVEELCLAKLVPYPQWFRAVVVEHRPGSATAAVLFIDYGNVEAAVPVSDLRKCMPEFCTQPVLAATADIKDWPKPPTTEQIVRAVEFLAINDEGRGTLHVTRCERVPDDLSYIIEVPQLIAAINTP